MLERFGGTVAPAIAERTAKACLLLPGDHAILEQADRLARLALAEGGNRTDFRPYALFAQGLALYRLGRYDDADRRLLEALSGKVSGWNLTMPANLVRAMAQRRLDHHEEARTILAGAIASARKDLAGSGGPRPGGDRHDRLICEVLRREAEAVILLDPAFPADPFAR
jgi:hypothetical protein